MPGTVRLHRVFNAPSERVFKAFLDPDALVKWMSPHGFTAKVHHLDPQVGGTYKMSFTNFSTGSTHSFSGKYIEIVPNELLRYTDQFDDPHLTGEIQMTIQLKPVLVGTEVNITQEGLPDVIPVEACYLGWQESLYLLGLLIQAEIPDQ
ncbi:toxin [Acinetobacter halotolerans]|uniref:Toxin n=2 Tax=Acinetobacter halotolerans TaxID=1752076 RepID=A0A4Q6XHD7_9GAMM|nr:toxin [Acinetobacter halotolerans]